MEELDSDILAAAWDNKHLLWELWKTPHHVRVTKNENKHFPYSLFLVIYNSSISQLL